ncbi:hypothetical protein C0992_007230, partial [Termitomyces sp. T32_za158]
MSQYQFDIIYVKGELNKVADCLLRYFESDTRDDVHNVHDFVQADKRIDPDGEDLPLHRFQEIAECHVEIRAMQAHALRRSKQLKEQLEVRDLEAQGLAGAKPAVMQSMEEPSSSDDDPTVEQALGIADPSPRTTDLEDAQLRARIRRGYSQDKFYVKILDKPLEHPRLVIEQKLIYIMSPAGVKVVCVPWDRLLITTILDQAHHIVGHFGYQKTLKYVRQVYWWPQMAKETNQF